MKALIIDDEPNGRDILETLIVKFIPSITEIKTADDVEIGVQQILSFQPDILFLDVEMPGGTGFNVLDDNRISDSTFHVIFTTAYENYAVKAIKYAALHYLLKPIDIEELKEAISRVAVAESLSAKTLTEKLHENKFSDRLRLVSKQGFDLIPCSEVIYCKSDSNYTRFVLVDGRKMLVSKTMGTYQEQLENNGFLRIHKSHIVNLSMITKYIHGKVGQVQLNNGESLYVSKDLKSKLLNLL